MTSTSDETQKSHWQWLIDTESKDQRLDHFLRDQDVGITRSHIKHLIEDGNVNINNQPCLRPSKKLKSGQLVELTVPPPEPLVAAPEPMELDIRYEDDALVVVNKPQGLVVHPAPGHPTGTLINGILHACSAAGGDPLRPGIVHRLDKDTSGLMVVAKRDDVHHHLAVQFHDHTVDRRYAVLVSGHPPSRGTWDTLHGRKDGDRKLFSTKVRRGKRAKSDFEAAEYFFGAALLKVTLHTGRTHQVRIHCYDHGFPVLGDPWYGPKRLPPPLRAIHVGLPGQALHAEVLGFEHPLTHERMYFTSDAPASFQDALKSLRALVK